MAGHNRREYQRECQCRQHEMMRAIKQSANRFRRRDQTSHSVHWKPTKRERRAQHEEKCEHELRHRDHQQSQAISETRPARRRLPALPRAKQDAGKETDDKRGTHQQRSRRQCARQYRAHWTVSRMGPTELGASRIPNEANELLGDRPVVAEGGAEAFALIGRDAFGLYLVGKRVAGRNANEDETSRNDEYDDQRRLGDAVKE